MDDCCATVANLFRRYALNVDDFFADSVADAKRYLEQQRELDVNPEEVQALATSFRRDRRVIKNILDTYRTELAAEHQRWFQAQASLSDSANLVMQAELDAVRWHYGGDGLSQGSGGDGGGGGGGGGGGRRNRTPVSPEQPATRRAAERLVWELHDHHLQALKTMASSPASASEAAASADSGGVSAVMPEDEQAKAEWTDDVCQAAAFHARHWWRGGQRKVLSQLASELHAERRSAGEMLEKQVAMAEQVGEAVRKSWAPALKHAQEELEQIAVHYRVALRAAMEAKLKEARRHATEQADFFNREMLEALKVENAEKELHKSQLRRMRISILKWRTDYLRDARQKAKESAARRRREKSLSAARRGGAAPVIRGPEDGDEAMAVESPRQAQEVAAMRKRLQSCQKVLAKIWERLPGEEEHSRDFLRQVERAVPFVQSVLPLYEDFLSEHGVVAALQTCRNEFPALGVGGGDLEGREEAEDEHEGPGAARRSGGGVD